MGELVMYLQQLIVSKTQVIRSHEEAQVDWKLAESL